MQVVPCSGASPLPAPIVAVTLATPFLFTQCGHSARAAARGSSVIALLLSPATSTVNQRMDGLGEELGRIRGEKEVGGVGAEMMHTGSSLPNLMLPTSSPKVKAYV